MTENQKICNISEKTSKEKPLTPRQTAAILILASTPKRTEALEIVGITRQTFNLWLKNPLFAEALEKVRGEAFKESLDTLRAAANKAVATLLNLLDEPDTDTRRHTAKAILEFALKIHETQDVIQRIEALERQIQTRR